MTTQASTAPERTLWDDAERGAALAAGAEEIRARMETPRSEHTDLERAFSAARSTLEAARAAARGAECSWPNGSDPARRRRTAATNRNP